MNSIVPLRALAAGAILNFDGLAVAIRRSKQPFIELAANLKCQGFLGLQNGISRNAISGPTNRVGLPPMSLGYSLKGALLLARWVRLLPR